jgi:putative ABC transport system substrate-binding protein
MSREHGAESKERRKILMMKKFFRLTPCAVLFALCVPAWAQQPKRIPRIGFLTAGFPVGSERHEAFRQGLRELGYVEGKNIVSEYR